MTISIQPEQVGLLTRHGKQTAIAPVLEQTLGWQLITTGDFDTDQLGTFSGETERTQTALACAEQKARLACELTGLTTGIGSEGTFGSGPYGPMLPWNIELLTMINQQQDWQITGIAQGPSFQRHSIIQSEQQLLAFFADSPANQALILYPQSRPEGILFKGLLQPDEVVRAFQHCRDQSNEDVMVEYDLRAMYCPERLNRIAEAATNLVERWQCRCPSCQRPGFWPDRVVDGLPCQTCQTPTHSIAERIAECQGCQYQQAFPVQASFADPAHCPYCNP